MKGFTMQVLERRSDSSPKVVEFTDAERLVADVYERLLDQGHSVVEAKLMIKSSMMESVVAEFTPEFWAFL